MLDRLSSSPGATSLYILWGFFALAAVMSAVAVCFTPGAELRFAAAMSIPDHPAIPAIPSRAERMESTENLLSRIERDAGKTQPSTDALAARLQALEEQIGITGSINRTSPPATPSQSQTTGATPAPQALSVQTTAVAVEPSLSRTQFGVDLGFEATMGALRTRWEAVKRKHGEMLKGLTPVVSIRDGRNGMAELRLIVGPYENAADAAKTCATLLASGVRCEGALYDGQRLSPG